MPELAWEPGPVPELAWELVPVLAQDRAEELASVLAPDKAEELAQVLAPDKAEELVLDPFLALEALNPALEALNLIFPSFPNSFVCVGLLHLPLIELMKLCPARNCAYPLDLNNM